MEDAADDLHPNSTATSGALRRLRRLRADAQAARREREEREDLSLLGAASLLARSHTRRQIRSIARASTSHRAVYHSLWAKARDTLSLDVTPELRVPSGSIICPAHFGLYLWIVPSLLKTGHRVALLADARNADLVSADAKHGAWPTLGQSCDRGSLRVISAERTFGLVELARAARSGWTCVLFVDGNSGADGLGGGDRGLVLPFMGARISVRRGIGMLSAVTGAPLHLVDADTVGECNPQLRLDYTLRRADNEDVQCYATRATAELFGALERRVLRRPRQWEEWALVPYWLNRDARCAASPHSAPPPSRSRRVTLRPGDSLVLLHDRVWDIRLRAEWHVVDVEQWHSIASGADAASLVRASERGDTVGEWLASCPNLRNALLAIQLLMEKGLVGVRSRTTGPPAAHVAGRLRTST